jgi:hypothetical protein
MIQLLKDSGICKFAKVFSYAATMDSNRIP